MVSIVAVGKSGTLISFQYSYSLSSNLRTFPKEKKRRKRGREREGNFSFIVSLQLICRALVYPVYYTLYFISGKFSVISLNIAFLHSFYIIVQTSSQVSVSLFYHHPWHLPCF